MKNNFIVLLICFVLLSCNNDNNVSSNGQNGQDVKDSTFFVATSGKTWQMKSNIGDSACFISRDTLKNVRFAPVFWDTSLASCFHLEAIPIEFIYWEGNMKRREYYALGITDTGFVFGAKKNPMIDKDYILEDLYSVFFFIPNDENKMKAQEVLFDSLQYGASKYYVETKVNWLKLLDNTFRVDYQSKRELVDPYKFSESFTFEKELGFSQFREYKLIKAD